MICIQKSFPGKNYVCSKRREHELLGSGNISHEALNQSRYNNGYRTSLATGFISASALDPGERNRITGQTKIFFFILRLFEA